MYKVLYRKWRPQTFADVSGQEHVTSTLAHEVATGKASHAYLFTGSRGTGKTTCAKILAKAVNCLHPVDGNPCNECEICRGIDDGSILDVIEIDAASNNGVDNIRDLREEANFTPVSAKYRVYIIDEVHMLSIGAFNALLKTLEEPPEHVKFILATTEVHKLPATILSRCQRFDFHRIKPEDIAARLNYVSEQEKIELESDAAVLIARIADGALRDALSILDRCAGISNHVTADIVGEAAGLAGKDYLFNLAESINNSDVSSALAIIDKLHNDSCDMERLCSELINHYRSLMIIKTVKNPQQLIVCTNSDFEMYKSQAEKINLQKVLSCLSSLEECAAALKTSTSKRTQTETTIIKMCYSENKADLSSLIERIEKLEKAISSGKITVNKSVDSPQPAKTESTEKENVQKADEYSNKSADYPEPPPAEQTSQRNQGENQDDIFFDGWSEVLEKLNETDKPLTGILNSSSAYIRNDFILIKCDNPIFSQFIRQPSHATAIKKAIYDVCGRKYRLGIYKSVETSEQSKDPLAELINKINN